MRMEKKEQKECMYCDRPIDSGNLCSKCFGIHSDLTQGVEEKCYGCRIDPKCEVHSHKPTPTNTGMAKIGLNLLTGECVPEETYEKNPDLYQLIEVKSYKDPRLTMLRAMIYEPEHTEGGMCWCGAEYVKVGKQMEIQHKEQRDTIINYVTQNFS